MALADLIDGGGTVTEIYGPGQAYQPCSGSFNPGLDVAAACGRITRAIGYGIVRSIGVPCWAGPHAVVIRSGDVDILYAHQSNHFVNSGDQVQRGSAVGAIGSMTGDGFPPCYEGYHKSACGGVATGPHLHWQVNPAGVDFNAGYCRGVNPMPYLESWPGGAPAAVYGLVSYPGPAPAGSSSLLPGLLALAFGGALVAYGVRRNPEAFRAVLAAPMSAQGASGHLQRPLPAPSRWA